LEVAAVATVDTNEGRRHGDDFVTKECVAGKVDERSRKDRETLILDSIDLICVEKKIYGSKEQVGEQRRQSPRYGNLVEKVMCCRLQMLSLKLAPTTDEQSTVGIMDSDYGSGSFESLDGSAGGSFLSANIMVLSTMVVGHTVTRGVPFPTTGPGRILKCVTRRRVAS
jgi:hypothetical protein